MIRVKVRRGTRRALLRHWTLFGVLSVFLIGGLGSVAVLPAASATPIVVATILITIVSLWLLLGRTERPESVDDATVGRDGIWFSTGEYVPRRTIEAKQGSSGAWLVLAGHGATLEGDARDVWAAHRLLARGAEHPADDLAASQVARGERDLAAWARALRGLQERGDYRDPPLRPDQLLRVAVDPEADPTARTGAAALLARQLDDESRVKLRVAAAETAHPGAREALLLACEGVDEIDRVIGGKSG
jgi:hypothetical protein